MSRDKYEWQVGATLPALEKHSAAKHAVLRGYVGRYIDVLTSDPRQDALNLTLVDGFAGGGEYAFRGGTSPGSPLILLEEVACAQARFNAQRTKPFSLKAEFIFVEQNSANMNHLKRSVNQSIHGTLMKEKLHFMNESFASALPRILEAIKSRGRAHRSIFFLDQYGYSDVSFDAIRQILTKLANPEIILTFNVDYLIDYMKVDERFLKAVVPVELELSHVQEMLAWKDTGQREARWLIQHFLYQHLMECTSAPYYTCFFIKSRESYKSYWLVHISKHPRARDEMAARHWAMSDHFIHHGGAGLHMLGFDPERDIETIPMDFVFDDNAESRSKDALMAELPPLIFDPVLGNGGGPTLERLFTRVCNETPATISLICDVLASLRAESEIEIVTSDGRPRPRSTQFDWTDVAIPARQRSMFSSVWPPRA